MPESHILTDAMTDGLFALGLQFGNRPRNPALTRTMQMGQYLSHPVHS